MHVRWSLPVALTLTTLAAQAAPRRPAADRTGCARRCRAAVAPALTSGLFLQNFDRTVRPQDDLYRFVNGTWLKTTEIPADKSNYGSFTLLADEAEKNLRVIVEEAAAAKAAPGSAQQLIGDFYSSFMDEAKAEQLGLDAVAARARPHRGHQGPQATARVPVARAAADDRQPDRRADLRRREEPRAEHAVGDAVRASACRSATTTSRPTSASRRSAPPTSSTSTTCSSSPAARIPPRSRRT